MQRGTGETAKMIVSQQQEQRARARTLSVVIPWQEGRIGYRGWESWTMRKSWSRLGWFEILEQRDVDRTTRND